MSINSSRFDAIVVGAGPSGSSAAYTLAKKGFKVLLVERGRAPGAKNMFGGRVYIAPLKEIYPDIEKKAPIHRWVKREKVSFINDNNMTSIEYESEMGKSFTTYLTQLSNWMAKQAESEGAILLNEITVDRLLIEDGRVMGIKVGDEELRANVVIDAEGANRLLLEKAGLVSRIKPTEMALGVKEVIKLNVDDINKMFGLENGEGLAWILMGDITDGTPGGAFIYTNKDSVSLGLVVYLAEAIHKIEKHISRYFERLRLHPLLTKYFKEGRIMEYSAHMIPEDIQKFRPKKLYHDGLLITGDAAGFLLNLGYTYRGVDFAAYSGNLAAKAIEDAHNKGDMTKENLSIYMRYLEKSFILRQLEKFKKVHDLMKKERLFTIYPQLINIIASEIFHIEWESPKIMEALKKAKRDRVGWLTLIKDLYEVSRKL
jgi:electron transfer flavoprotein-quinone oxidoreductase